MSKARATEDEQFDRFWDQYPRHVAKKDALKAWRRIDPTTEMVDRMIDAIGWQRQTPAWTRDGGAYVPYPATWLRGERWDDEPFEPARPLGKLTHKLLLAIQNIKRETP